MHMLDALQQQKIQYKHDQRNHADILSLHKTERLKHYALHFGKYVGRVMGYGSFSVERTLVDALLVSLSSANTLNLNLNTAIEARKRVLSANEEFFVKFAVQMGKLSDACEKIDHLEPFEHMARDAAAEIYYILEEEFSRRQLDAAAMLEARREELSRRSVYVD